MNEYYPEVVWLREVVDDTRLFEFADLALGAVGSVTILPNTPGENMTLVRVRMSKDAPVPDRDESWYGDDTNQLYNEEWVIRTILGVIFGRGGV